MSNSMDLWRAYRSIKMDTFGPLRVFGGIPETPVEFLQGGISRFLFRCSNLVSPSSWCLPRMECSQGTEIGFGIVRPMT